MSPGRLALVLVILGVAIGAFGFATPAVREAAIVTGLFCVFLAGGVLNWDRRGGH